MGGGGGVTKWKHYKIIHVITSRPTLDFKCVFLLLIYLVDLSLYTYS